MVVADFVNCEEQVDEVACCPKLLPAGIGVCPRAEELAAALLEKLELFSGKEVEAEHPFSRGSASLLVMLIEGGSPRADCMEIRETVGSCSGRHED